MPGDVPALDEGVQRRLPVGRQDHRLVPGDAHVLELEAVQPLGDRVEERLQRLGVRVHVHEHPPAPRTQAHLGEAELLRGPGLEAVRVGLVLERAVEVPPPRVERAPELAHPALAAHQAGPAVAAGVVEGVQAVLGADHHHGRAADLDVHIVPHPLHLVRAAGVEPRPREEALQLQLQELAVHVAALRHEPRAEPPPLGHVRRAVRAGRPRRAVRAGPGGSAHGPPAEATTGGGSPASAGPASPPLPPAGHQPVAATPRSASTAAASATRAAAVGCRAGHQHRRRPGGGRVPGAACVTGGARVAACATGSGGRSREQREVAGPGVDRRHPPYAARPEEAGPHRHHGPLAVAHEQRPLQVGVVQQVPHLHEGRGQGHRVGAVVAGQHPVPADAAHLHPARVGGGGPVGDHHPAGRPRLPDQGHGGVGLRGRGRLPVQHHRHGRHAVVRGAPPPSPSGPAGPRSW